MRVRAFEPAGTAGECTTFGTDCRSCRVKDARAKALLDIDRAYPVCFDGMKGGRTRVSDAFIDGNSVSCPKRGTATVSCKFWRQNTVWDAFGPRRAQPGGRLARYITMANVHKPSAALTGRHLVQMDVSVVTALHI